jgi:Protein of unknown function (DUF3822)
MHCYLLPYPYNRQKYLILPPQTKIVEPSFNIRSENTHTAQQHLLVEAGPQGLSLVCADADTKIVTSCVVYHFTPGMHTAAIAEQLSELFATEPLLRHSYKKTDFVYAFNQAILTPHEVYNAVSNTEMLDGVYGDAADAVLKTDFVYKQNIHCVYRVPVAVNTVVTRAFPAAGITHQYSLLADAFGGGSSLYAVFYTNSLTVLLRKEGRLQVVQQLAYDTPETAAWHLLNTCRCFDVQANNTALVLYGMIDSKSALFAELYKYFQQVSFAALPDGLQYSSEITALPPHFFSHLFAMKLCV